MSANLEGKTVYFVRHGETVANLTNSIQGSDDELSPNGLLQAQKIANRITQLSVGQIISSDFVRARQTTEIILEKNQRPCNYSPLFREIWNPTSLIGVPRANGQFQTFIEEQKQHYTDPLWHYEDEENFSDRVKRAQLAEIYIEEQETHDLLIVTHGNFLKFLLGFMLFKDIYSADIQRSFHKAIYTSNVGLSILRQIEGRWQAITINDHAHLAD